MRRLIASIIILLILISPGSHLGATTRTNSSPVRLQPQSLAALYLNKVLPHHHRLGRVRKRPRPNTKAAKTETISPSSLRKPVPQIVIPLLAYHHLAPEYLNLHQSGETTTPEQFERDLLALKGKGYTTIFFGDLLNYLDGKGDLPEKPAIIFFDDGYQSNYFYAWPLLKKHGLTATINLVTAWITEKAPPFDPHQTTYLSWEQIKEMVGSGEIDIQSHTHDLHRETHGEALVKQVDERHLRQDFATSKWLIEHHTGKPVTVLSYPFGVYTALSDRVGREFFRISLGPRGADAMGYPLGVSTRRLYVQYHRHAEYWLRTMGE